MKPIRLTTEEEFERLRDRIDLEASDAEDHWQLLNGLRGSFSDYYVEMNQSWTFWEMTFKAHYGTVLLHLCRLYDQDTAALSLGRFLLTVKEHTDYYSDAAFKRRLQDNPHVDGLAAGRIIDRSILDEEIASVSGADPLVARLHKLRNTALSHRSAEVVRTSGSRPLRPLPDADIEALLARARALTAKYSLLYKASRYAGVAGADDYRTLLRLLREARSSRQKKIDKQIKMATAAEGPKG